MKNIIIKSNKMDGLGAQINYLRCVYNFAKTNGFNLLIDWRFYYNYSDRDINLFGILFETNNEFKIIDNNFFSENNSYYPEIWNNDNINTNFDPHFGSNHKLDIDILTTKKYENFVISHIAILKNIYQINNNYNTLFFTNLIPVKEIQNEVNKFLQLFDNQKVLTIHYRHGNGEFKNGQRKTDLFDEYFLEIDKIIKNDKNILIYLCSDNKNVIKTFKNRYKNILTRNIWLPDEENGPIHGGSRKNGNILYVNKEQLAKDTIIDIWILSKGDFFIYNMSWLAKVALMMNNKTCKSVNLNVLQ